VSAAKILVEVVYALPQRQLLRRVTLEQGSRVGDALAASGLLEEFPEIVSALLGIYGASVQPGAVLRDRDRVEIYRPLRVDPKEIRRRRAGGRRRGDP
jgi:putative ubiquitin-RnfH superfamily antitoxin RatB of RatAB toxin-antitoxin module